MPAFLLPHHSVVVASPDSIVLGALRAKQDWMWDLLSPDGRAKLVMCHVLAAMVEKKAPASFQAGATLGRSECGVLQLH